MTFGQRVREYRKKLRLSQNALAELAGVSPRTIFGYEVGTTFPRTETILNRLADALGITREELVGNTMKTNLVNSDLSDLSYEIQAQILTRKVTSLLYEDGFPSDGKDMMVKAIMDAYWESRRRCQVKNDTTT